MYKRKSQRIAYSLISSSIVVEENAVTSYGILCTRNNEPIERIEDISTDREKISALVKKLNKYRLDPAQLEDVIEDSLI